KEALLEALAGNGGFYQLRIDCPQRVQIVLFDHSRFHLIQDPRITYLRLFALWRITFSLAAGERFFEDKANVQLCAPAEAFGKRQGKRVTVVNLGEEKRICRVDTVTADHARVDVQRHQRPLARSTPSHHKINGLRIEQ